MCYLASEISALATECSRFALGQDMEIENERRRGQRGNQWEASWGLEGGDSDAEGVE